MLHGPNDFHITKEGGVEVLRSGLEPVAVLDEPKERKVDLRTAEGRKLKAEQAGTP
jgi:hypothetical protein